MATETHHDFLTSDARMRLPNPDEALNIAYAIHSADDLDTAGAVGREVARSIALSFSKLEGRRGTPEKPYVDSIKPIVYSYARAISRRKEKYRNDLMIARRIRVEKQRQLTGGRLSKHALAVLGRIALGLIAPAMLFLFGLVIAAVFGTVVPENIADKTPDYVPSVALGLFFAFVGRVVGTWFIDQAYKQITLEYDTRRSNALREYEHGKVYEFTLARQRLCEAWRQYTGRSYRRTVHYQEVMEGDIALRDRQDAYLRELNKEFVHRVRDFLIDLRKVVRQLRPLPSPQAKKAQ